MSLHEVDTMQCDFSVLLSVLCRQPLSKLKKGQHKSFQNDVTLRYVVLAHCAFVLAPCIEKDIAVGCCVIESLPVTRLM